MSRMLEITYQSAWFLCHRIREAMTDEEPNKTGGARGGPGKVVEEDETVVGGKDEKSRLSQAGAKEKRSTTLLSGADAFARSTSLISTPRSCAFIR